MALASSFNLTLLLPLVILGCLMAAACGNNFDEDFDITWGDGRGKIVDNGEALTLSLDKASGSAFQSKDEYLFAKIDIKIKLVPGNSAGTVTSFYLSSQGPTFDEIDLEFFGNLSGDPYTLQTNVFTRGKGNREQQIFLWFDPTADFHTYSILWNRRNIIFFVDDIPIREFKNLESKGNLFPKNQPMRLHSSLWNGEDWATRGGLVKTDWTQAPFTVTYKDFHADACIWSNGISSCNSKRPTDSDSDRHQRRFLFQELNEDSRSLMYKYQKDYMIYDYCHDFRKYVGVPPPECPNN
ncbi:Glycoside hydrolase, family 16 [Corchorus olitorius]|uniref:Xyloglucan endotransglucosylase/hydrolase n=1 Tax=Corchorus olitorius TaxID=93759 RepID=A0A1R3HNS8_9ROSI|nr:Glycoside hydrolase, family 16 [Corchorus olitorius]